MVLVREVRRAWLGLLRLWARASQPCYVLAVAKVDASAGL